MKFLVYISLLLIGFASLAQENIQVETKKLSFNFPETNIKLGVAYNFNYVQIAFVPDIEIRVYKKWKISTSTIYFHSSNYRTGHKELNIYGYIGNTFYKFIRPWYFSVYGGIVYGKHWSNHNDKLVFNHTYIPSIKFQLEYLRQNLSFVTSFRISTNAELLLDVGSRIYFNRKKDWIKVDDCKIPD